VKLNPLCIATARMIALTLTVSAVTSTVANDAMKAQSALTQSSAQPIKQPSATLSNEATMNSPRSPGLPMAPVTPMKPPTAQLQKQHLNVPQISSIQLLNQSAVVAGDTLTLRVYGMTPERGSVMIKVKSKLPEARADLALNISLWDVSNNVIRGTVAQSRGLGDGHAMIIVNLPNGNVVQSGLISTNMARIGGAKDSDMPFVASRAEQTIPASAAQPDHLSANLAEPAAREIKQGGQLLNGIAYSRIRSEGDPSGLGCRLATPQDRFKLKLAVGFELSRVNGRDLNAGKRYGLTEIGVCDIRSTVPAATFVQAARDGSFVINSTWDVVNRLGAKATAKSGRDCGGSRYHGVTKTPLGFDWDNTGADRCAVNAEYVIDAFVVRGPAGVNPLLGSANNGAAAR
jgi:hypothetical protein